MTDRLTELLFGPDAVLGVDAKIFASAYALPMLLRNIHEWVVKAAPIAQSLGRTSRLFEKTPNAYMDPDDSRALQLRADELAVFEYDLTTAKELWAANAGLVLKVLS
jgi:hypothetical protein